MGIYIDDCLIIAPSDAGGTKVYKDLNKSHNWRPYWWVLGVKV